MWRRVALRKRLCDSLFTRFDGAVYYASHASNRIVVVHDAIRRDDQTSFVSCRPLDTTKGQAQVQAAQ
ncbi:hypothetical protein EVAR_27550_1 [Eumeta japonica]|uniref:Uncharacterized protein n=1 Tax=Eumeta variegata TaxID=151549 RepID=A0A4C1WDB5_EUMVA|nr:hypothetical protein EVAR_27550_1 [Eumeta japonica]